MTAPKQQQTLVATALYTEAQLIDLEISFNGRTMRMLGAGGALREESALADMENWLHKTSNNNAGQHSCADASSASTSSTSTSSAKVSSVNVVSARISSAITSHNTQSVLPVLLGSGVGFALEKLVITLEQRFGADFFLIVVDKETAITKINGLKKKFAKYVNITWVEEADVSKALTHITKVQNACGKIPLKAIFLPFYMRLDREYYASLQESCAASFAGNFWEKVNYTKFTTKEPKILLITSKYFLIGEVKAACLRLGIEHHFMSLEDTEYGHTDFVEELLRTIVSFTPDFVLTLNHLGIDREGVLTNLLEQLRLPLASWFVDNPHLILHAYSRLVSPWIALFTWDKDNISSLKKLGFEHVFYLPLGVDVHRFQPLPALLATGKQSPADAKSWGAKISFVGNSMVNKVEARKRVGAFPKELLKNYQDVAAAFAMSEERTVTKFLQAHFPLQAKAYEKLESIERKLAYETMLTWEATLQYRLSCIEAILPFSPLIVGDDGWFKLLGQKKSWQYHSELNYYDDLPFFYPLSTVNFNCTSKQMKGAVNQRVFDVPAAGAFLLTDYREQVEFLFEPGKEIICYHSLDEIPALIEKYLADTSARVAVTKAAYGRILAEHTYEHRLQSIMATMQKTFG